MPTVQTRLTLILPLLLLCANWPSSRAAAALAPVAQILAPQSGVKLRQGQDAAVIIRVQGTDSVSWDLSLQESGAAATPLAKGTGPVAHGTVAQIDATTLDAGVSYTLALTAKDGAATATAVARFTIPDPHYTLIPLNEGNFQESYYTYGVDFSGDQVLYSSATGDPAPITVLHRQTGQRNLVLLQLDNSTGPKFSSDATRLFYTGFFKQGGFTIQGLGYRDLRAGTDVLLVDRGAYPFYTVDHAGQRVALLTSADGVTTQYFLYDQTTNETRQLTSDPAAVSFISSCTGQLGTTPFITADGGTVVMITSATLGIMPADPSIGCRIFVYDVAGGTLRQVAALPQTFRDVVPALSADGHWLSFAVNAPWGSSGSRSIPALVDLQTGTVSAPLVDVGPYTSFDAAVTPDGDGIVISTEADLDPRVGNADHNMELFYYDRASGHFTQISETLLGIGSTPNNCASYLPGVSHDGEVVVFSFAGQPDSRCHLDGRQRNEADGLVFDFVRAVRKRPGNQPVVLDAVPDRSVIAGSTLTLNLTAHDPDGDLISFFAQEKDGQDVFPGSTITDHHDGTASFQWATRPQDAGDHVLRVAAFDEGGGEMFQDVTISVVPRSAACAGDCAADGLVSVDDIVRCVRIALGETALGACLACDADSDGQVNIDELVAAVGNALNGCP